LISRELFATAHRLPEKLEEVRFVLGEVGEPGKVDGHDADRTRHGIRGEQSTAFHARFVHGFRAGDRLAVQLGAHFAVVEPESAAHAARVLFAHVGVDEIAEVGRTVFRRHLPDGFVSGIIPIEILGDIVGRDREGERAVAGVADKHNFRERLVDHLHLYLVVSVSRFLHFSADDDSLIL
jgi:hypothetical protein